MFKRTRETVDEVRTIIDGMSENAHMDLCARDMDAYYGPDFTSWPDNGENEHGLCVTNYPVSPPPVHQGQVKHLMPYKVRHVAALCWLLADWIISAAICAIRGHDLIDPLDGNPESGWVSVACKRCGFYQGGYW